MRSKEFVTETINPDCFNPAFNDTQHFDGLTYRATVEEEYGKPVLTVKVLDDNFQQAGLAKFKPSKAGVVSLITSFRPEYQGQGLARNIYAYVRAMGNTIVPSRNQLPGGRAMWDSWKKSGDAKHLMRDVAEGLKENNHWHAAGVADAQRDAKLYPDRVVKKLNPRTRLKTMQDKQARHPEEVEQYSLGYRSLKQGVAEQAVTETAEELQELTQFSKGMANFLAKSYAQYIKNPQTAKYVQQQISQPITDGAPYRALMPAIGIVSVPGADTYTSPGLELAKKFVNMVVAYFPAPGDADYNGFSEAAPAVYDARPRTVVINKDYLSDPTYLASTIAHEVQHSIDDLKSRKGLSVKTDQQDLELSYYDQGKAFKQKQSAGATNNAQKYQSYLSMPHEVNARFTEVINDIKQRIEKEDIQNIGSAGLSELARSAFNQHYMHEVFPNGAKDPGYKRLLSRVYAWLSKYYNDRIDRNGSFNPQPATPLLEEQGVAEGICSLEEAHEIFDDFEQAMAERGLTEDAFDTVTDEQIVRETAAWRRKAGKSAKGGLNRKGVASYRRENPGSKLQMAVTTKPSKLKPGSKAAKRRKSFCARMSGVQGPMKKPNGKPTRKALALRKWNC